MIGSLPDVAHSVLSELKFVLVDREDQDIKRGRISGE